MENNTFLQSLMCFLPYLDVDELLMLPADRMHGTTSMWKLLTQTELCFLHNANIQIRFTQVIIHHTLLQLNILNTFQKLKKFWGLLLH